MTEGKWGSVEKVLQEIEKLLEEKYRDDDQKILLTTRNYINLLKS